MCSLFGIIDYGNVFSAKEKNQILRILSTECEARGTDATGIAYNCNGKMRIYKRPIAAHKMWYRVPDNAAVIMGHTRMTTQGNAKFNYNNHPFPGIVGNTNFALAHNGVLHNDFQLQYREKLPKTQIQTDSYVAVQLIEKERTLSFDSIRKMAEKTEGSFCYTILDDRNNLYIVKGDNPMAIFKFNGFYLYASTEDILTKAVNKLGLKNYSKVKIACGEILKINANGVMEMQEFSFPDIYSCFPCSYYDTAYYDDSACYDDYAIEILAEYAGYFGIAEEDVYALVDYGYDELEIEEMLYDPVQMQRCISELRLMEMC